MTSSKGQGGGDGRSRGGGRAFLFVWVVLFFFLGLLLTAVGVLPPFPQRRLCQSLPAARKYSCFVLAVCFVLPRLSCMWERRGTPSKKRATEDGVGVTRRVVPTVYKLPCLWPHSAVSVANHFRCHAVVGIMARQTAQIDYITLYTRVGRTGAQVLCIESSRDGGNRFVVA